MRFTRGYTNQKCPICGYSLQADVEKDPDSLAGSKSAAYVNAIVTHIQSVHPDFWNWEQSKRRLGVGLGIITGALTGVGLLYLDIVLQVSGAKSWGYAIASVSFTGFFIPLWLITRRGAEHFRAQWLEQGKTATPTFEKPVEPTISGTEPAADDFSIVSLAIGLTSRLGILDMRISNVDWKSLIPQGKGFVRIPPDAAVFRGQTMYLAANMQGKLSTNEWKPLIASAMINYRKLRPLKIRLVVGMALPVIIAYVASWIFLPPLFPTTHSCANGQCAYQNLGMFIMIFGGVGLFFALIILSVIMIQKFQILSDLETIQYLGKSALTGALQKVSQESLGYALSVQRRINRIERSTDLRVE